MGSPTGLSLDYTSATMKKNVETQIPDGWFLGREELKERLKLLEEEKRKIDAFKRELPLCMELVDDEIANVRRQMTQNENRKDRSIGENSGEDKINWTSSAQLWSDNQIRSDLALKMIEVEPEPEPVVNVNRENFSVDRKKGCSAIPPLQGSLCGGERVSAELTLSTESKPNSSPPAQSGLQWQLLRKARRCWSPELHRRFVNALQQLGGAQVATPKQIRGLMKVDGLTNDEVKSHLQKYRLHARKPNLSTQILAERDSSSAAPFVLFGRIWTPRDFSDPTNPAQSVSPQGPLQLARMTHKSIRVLEEEDGESDKSESYSWKGSRGVRRHCHRITSRSRDRLSE